MNLDDFDYSNKVMMAPMVRAGRTPLRVLALDYGADVCYTEEIVDQKLLSCNRVENEALGTIDYCMLDDVVLRVAPKQEKNKCVLQIGTNNGKNAAEVAVKIGKDVSAIDVNMGCPKPFSVHQGMGAALLQETDKIKDILCSLKAAASVPISCKIRVLDDPHLTLNLVREIEKCGVSAIGVHGRRRDERNPDRCRLEEIREVVRTVSVPIIANGISGEVNDFEDISKFKSQTGASSVMIARKALQNPSIFRKEGLLTMENDIVNFLAKACEFDESYTMTKYVVQRILGSEQEHDVRGKATVAAGSVLEICKAWSVEHVYEEFRQKRARQQCKRKYDEEEDGTRYIDITFPLKKLREPRNLNVSPKTVLHDYLKEKGQEKASYSWIRRDIDKRYEGVVVVNGQKFSSRKGQPNIKMAEQVAALSALIGMNIRDRLKGEWEE
ncbi:unnamed protein product [Auanema sp. JU1783]|nr:unnamed protein product [Auanema sp. JU1783]